MVLSLKMELTVEEVIILVLHPTANPSPSLYQTYLRFACTFLLNPAAPFRFMSL